MNYVNYDKSVQHSYSIFKSSNKLFFFYNFFIKVFKNTSKNIHDFTMFKYQSRMID